MGISDRFGGTYPDVSEMGITTIVAVDIGCLSNVGSDRNTEGDDWILKDGEPFFLLRATSVR